MRILWAVGVVLAVLVALAVGVYSLLGTTCACTIAQNETDAVVEDSVFYVGETESVTITVVDEDGSPVEGATVIVSSEETARVEDTVTATTDPDGVATVRNLDVSLTDNESNGYLSVDIVPPEVGNYVDEQPNPEIVVVDADSAGNRRRPRRRASRGNCSLVSPSTRLAPLVSVLLDRLQNFYCLWGKSQQIYKS